MPRSKRRTKVRRKRSRVDSASSNLWTSQPHLQSCPPPMTDTLPLLAFHVHARRRLARAPILAPLLIVVEEGEKQITLDGQSLTCPAGHWIALAGRQRVDMQNTPDDRTGQYRARAPGSRGGGGE